MKPIASVSDVQAVFPGVDFDEAGVAVNEGGIFLNCHTAYAYNPPELGYTGSFVLDGNFTPEQILALAYWATHLTEFAEPSEGPLPKLNSLPSINSATDVFAAFPDAEFVEGGFFDHADALACWADDGHGSPSLGMDGTFELQQLLAMAYWVTHLDEFQEIAAQQ
jgi:hypothetical protein